MDDIRDKVEGPFSRIHLIQKQDIKNIATSFNIDKIQRHTNDQDSVLSWINEWKTGKENPVLFYKLQGSFILFRLKMFKSDYNHSFVQLNISNSIINIVILIMHACHTEKHSMTN